MLLKKLAEQTAVYGISSIVARLLNYLLTPYLTRILTTSEYGVITDMYALIPFVMVLLTMGMESGYFRFAGKAGSDQEKKRVFSTTWSAVTMFSVLFLSVVLMFNSEIALALDYADNPSYIWMVATIIALDAITAIPFAKLREQGKAMKFVIIRVVSVLINVVLCFALYGLLPHLAEKVEFLGAIYDPAYGAGYYFVANLVASIVTLLLLLPYCGFTKGFIDKKILYAILLYSLPLLLSGIAGTANEFIDRQMIKYLMPQDIALSSLGIYGAVVKIGVVLLLFTQMYRMAAEPFFLANFKREEFVKTNAEALKFFIIVSMTIFLGISLFAQLFSLIVGEDFREGMYILPVVLVSNILSGVVLNLSFWYKQTGKTKFALYVTCTGLVFTVVFNFLLVPILGYFGSAIARLICEVMMVALSYYLNRRYYPTPYNLKRIGEYVLLGALLYCGGFLTDQLPLIPKYLCNLALLTVFVLYALRREHIDVVVIVRSVVKRK